MRIRTMVTCALAALLLTGCPSKDTDKSADEDDTADSEESSEDDDDSSGKKKKKKKKKKNKKGKKKKKKSSDDDDGGGDDGAVSCGPPNEVPAIPSTRSAPPTLDEWGKGCDVNTQGANSQPGDCTMKVYREWLQVTCRGDVTGYEKFDRNGFGSKGQDWFEHHRAGQLASFVVRLRKGRNPKVRICRGNERASLFVSWPPSKSKPTIIALGIGPRCDNSAWGTVH